jgi:hypothetical protein
VRIAYDNHLIEMRIVADDRRRVFFDEVGDAGVGILSADGPDGGCRKHDVANQPKPD